MTEDRFKEAFVDATAQAFRRRYPSAADPNQAGRPLNRESLAALLEKPKDPKMGRLALPVFRFAGALKKSPPEIAADIARVANQVLESSPDSGLVHCQAAGGFVNCQVDFDSLARQTIDEILRSGARYGDSTEGNGKTVLVEYSSANIAKPFGIGHLRSTIVGHSLRRIFAKLGYRAVGINYLGDWGTQFGKMIVAWRRWGAQCDLSTNAVGQLLQLYVRFHKEAETDPSLETDARQAFRQLELGDPETVALWERFRDISMAEFNRIYEILGVDFDWITGESFLNDKMEAAIERLEKAGLTSISEGALVVDLKDEQLPPCMLRKTDGATLYATREITSLLYRWEHYHFEQSLYVVGGEQLDHFKQALRVIDLLEQAEQRPENQRMTGRVHHIDFGWVRFGDQRLSTRLGQVVFLEDVYETARAKARQIILERNPAVSDVDRVALMIGLGAVVFAQLSVRRQKDINLIWDDILSFEGETGPYLQYTHARLCSLLHNYGREVSPDFDVRLLNKEEEQRVVELLADFLDVVREAAGVYDPQVIAAYLLRLAGAFNRFYQRKDEHGRIDKIISDDAALTAARTALVKTVKTVIGEGLYLLGIQGPEAM